MSRVFSLILKSLVPVILFTAVLLLLDSNQSFLPETLQTLIKLVCLALIIVVNIFVYKGTSAIERKVMTWAYFCLGTLSLLIIILKKQSDTSVISTISIYFLFAWIAGFAGGSRRNTNGVTSQPAVNPGIKIYTEKDNLGTLHETYEKAFAYWINRQRLPKKEPFVMYVFTNETDAREALLDIPCIKIAQDSQKLICTEVLIYGYYRVDNTFQAILCGEELTHDLWEIARESFKRHGGTLRNELEPGTDNPHNTDIKDNISSTEPVVFVKEDRINDQYGTTIYRIYKAPNANAAKEYLSSKPVTRTLYYIIVETPEGNYGRDINGIYKEQV